jgi:hypothetical protein
MISAKFGVEGATPDTSFERTRFAARRRWCAAELMSD